MVKVFKDITTNWLYSMKQVMTIEDLEDAIEFVKLIPQEDYAKGNFSFNDYEEDWLKRRKNNRMYIKGVVFGERRKHNLGGYIKCECGILKKSEGDNYHINNKYHKLWLKQNLF